MNLKLNATTLADLIAGCLSGVDAHGLPDDGSVEIMRRFRADTADDPRLVRMYWFLLGINRNPGALEELIEAVDSRDFLETLKCLADEACNFYHAGHCPVAVRGKLYQRMQAHAKAARATLADTKVSRTILKELDLALEHKVPLPIIGDSRFGKTKAVSVWCEMRPGHARLVTVPETNREWDFFAAHADALGITYNDRTPAPRLKRAVEWVLRQSRLFICYDEAHFLVPVDYCRDTPPRRINWVRCQVIDKGIGCAFLATPQSLDQTMERYAARTKYNFEQWLGRLAPPIVLTDYYDRAELMAVARIHFPEFPEQQLALICARAMQTEAYLKGMEFAARYATALALESRRRQPSLQDVDAAIERMMPRKAVAQTAAETPDSRPLKPALTPPKTGSRGRVPVVASDSDEAAETLSPRPTGITVASQSDSPRATRELVAA